MRYLRSVSLILILMVIFSNITIQSAMANQQTGVIENLTTSELVEGQTSIKQVEEVIEDSDIEKELSEESTGKSEATEQELTENSVIENQDKGIQNNQNINSNHENGLENNSENSGYNEIQVQTIDTLASKQEKYNTGDKGNHVIKLKQNLSALGFGNFPKNPSPTYGNVTKRVVMDFQKHYNLSVTGVANQSTLNKIQEVLNPPYKSGDRGTAIVKLKRDLKSLGYGNFPKNPSINYGRVTANIVKEFQKDHKLKQDGVAGQSTLNAIKEATNFKLNAKETVQLKKNLTALGFGNFPKNPSGTYGKVTKKFVKEFQEHYKIAATGNATQRTLNKIAEILNPPYKPGDRGTAIVKLKKDLKSLGYGNFPNNPSINYGKVTANIVKEFQKDHGLAQDGLAGQSTLNAIKEASSFKLSSSQTIKLKKDLTALGFGNFPKNPSGTYGKVTKKTVREFQKHYKIAATGNATEPTLNKIQEVLNPPYTTGDRGVAIVNIKKNLTKLGYGDFPKKPSINYGKVTATVVKEFQRIHGLKVTGIADDNTVNLIKNTADKMKNINLQYEYEVFVLTNKERLKHNVPVLKYNDKVARLAREHSLELEKSDKLVHSKFGDNLRANNLLFKNAGENVARGYKTPTRVVNGWMNSPGHKRNILNPKYDEIGIGYSAEGNQWTQIFYTPR